MSAEQERIIDIFVKWILRIAVAILSITSAFFLNSLTATFNKIEVDIELIKSDLGRIKENTVEHRQQIKALERQVYNITDEKK